MNEPVTLGRNGRYRHHKYKWSMPFGTVKHHWEFVAPNGALHFHGGIYNGQPSFGLEIHSCAPRADRAPDHVDCPLTGGRCWHDGTSLYATEHLWPYIEGYLRSGEHERIFLFLEGEADERFGFKPESSP